VDHDARREHLEQLAAKLPEATITGEVHRHYVVRGRTFGYYLVDHHGDGLIGLVCKVPRGENDELVRLDPERYYTPAYLGPRGWLALRLDLPEIDWGQVEDLLTDSSRLFGPRKLSLLV
jgi:hypothetical protein